MICLRHQRQPKACSKPSDRSGIHTTVASTTSPPISRRKDTAYTSESLEPHNDNTYFTEAAGLQALHLLSHTDGSGGESSLVDGFGMRQLSSSNKTSTAYLPTQLSITPVRCSCEWERRHQHSAGRGKACILRITPFQLQMLNQVRWNNADRAGVSASHEDMDEWYDAAA